VNDDSHARQHALRGAHRLLDAVAGVGLAQHDLGAAERLDAALTVDLLDRHVGAHLLELALPRPPAGQRGHERDLDVLRGRRGWDDQRRGGDEDQEHGDGEPADPKRHRNLLP